MKIPGTRCEVSRTIYFRFRLIPDVMIALGTKTKVPGEMIEGERIELVARLCHGNEMDPYERLLGDSMKVMPRTLPAGIGWKPNMLYSRFLEPQCRCTSTSQIPGGPA